MKNLFLFVITALLVASCTTSTDTNYSINGTIDGEQEALVVLNRVENNDLAAIDSINMTDGSFTFEGMIEGPEMFYIKVGDKKEMISFWVDKADIKVKASIDSLSKAEVMGSKSNDEFIAFNEGIKVYGEQMRELYSEYRAANQEGNAERVAEIEAEYEELDKKQTDYMEGFVSENKASAVAPYVFYRHLAYGKEAEEMDSVLNTFDPSIANTQYYVILKERIELLKRVAVGQPYIDFEMADTEGNMVKLSSLIGENYLLMDFWASWCGPCRQENPNVVRLYNKYHEKGFDIIGISFDRTKEDWLKGIEEDGLTWHHVSDIKFWDNAAGKLYGVRSIPHTILLDKDGTIIAKNLRGEALEAKLAELLD